jgi:ArsR family transcriptional regulator, arsenate/arsenite/antimonite-responsive transcriptional repressor
MKAMDQNVTRYADMFAALGAEPRLRIVRLLLSAHPEGMVVNEIQTETGVAGSTLSHHLEKLKNDELVTAEREKAFIRYRANTGALEELLGFLYAECCTRNKACEPRRIAALCK